MKYTEISMEAKAICSEYGLEQQHTVRIRTCPQMCVCMTHCFIFHFGWSELLSVVFTERTAQ